MENRTMATADTTPAPLPEAISAALGRVRGPKGREAFAEDFAALARETDLDKSKQLEWMLFGALRYAWRLGQLSYEGYHLLTDFSSWSPVRG